MRDHCGKCSSCIYHHWKSLTAKRALGRQLNSYSILKIIGLQLPYLLIGGLAQVLAMFFFPFSSLDKSQRLRVSRLIVSFHWRENTTLGPNFTPWPWLWFIPVVYGIYSVSITLQKSKCLFLFLQADTSTVLALLSTVYFCSLFFFQKEFKIWVGHILFIKKNLYHFLIIFFWGNGRDVWGCDGIQLNAAKK